MISFTWFLISKVGRGAQNRNPNELKNVDFNSGYMSSLEFGRDPCSTSFSTWAKTRFKSRYVGLSISATRKNV